VANPGIQAVVLPVFDKYLDVLSQRTGELTTMIWGWQGEARRVRAPASLLRRQRYVPFLFRSLEAAGQVTHAALSGLILHRDSAQYRPLATWLDQRRVERFAGSKWGDRTTTLYVVTGGHKLPTPVPFQSLTLVSEGRPLTPGMLRGYATVFLPDSLVSWYQTAIAAWDRLGAPQPARAV